MFLRFLAVVAEWGSGGGGVGVGGVEGLCVGDGAFRVRV